MESVDLKKLQMAHIILAAVVDRLTELDDLVIDVDFESVPNEVEIDRVTPDSDYCRECGCCEGMDW